MKPVTFFPVVTLFTSVVLGSLAGCGTLASSVPESRKSTPAFYEETPPGVIERYNAFYIQPVKVFSIENDHLRAVTNSDTKKLAESLRAKLIKRLGDKQATLPVAASGVAVMDVTIADVSSNYAAFQLMPGLLAPNVMRGGASIEVRVVDSINKKQLAVFRDTRQGARQGFLSGLGKWDGVEKAFDEWADMLNAKLHG